MEQKERMNLAPNQKNKLIMKKKKSKNKKQPSSIEPIKKYWSGGIDLAVSFWLFGIVALSVASIPNYIMYPNIDNFSDSETISYLIYLIFFYSLTIFVWVGLWRSAKNYIVKKEKKGLSPGWGRGAQVWIVLSILGMIKNLVFG